jgi:Ca2+-binding RTX toxin-like protein
MATINGTSRHDNLIGTPKSDRISGNLGNDTLTGGGSPDTFVFNNLIETVRPPGTKDILIYSTDGLDTIKDFSGMALR